MHWARHHSTFDLPHRAFGNSVEADLQFHIAEEILSNLGGLFDLDHLHYVVSESLFLLLINQRPK